MELDEKSRNCYSKPIKIINDGELFDSILSKIGSSGRYQKFLMWCFVCPTVFLQPILTMNFIFMFFIPDHFCQPPNSGLANLDLWKNESLPKITGSDGNLQFSQCQMYLTSRNQNDSTTYEIIDCPNGWDFDRTDYDQTIPSEFNWVCSKAHFSTTIFTITSFGAAIGNVLLGQLSDKYGRKLIFFMSFFSYLVLGVLVLFVPQYFEFFAILQFIRAICSTTLLTSPITILAEISDKDYRAYIFGTTWIIWVLGCCFLPFLAWISRTWFNLGLLTTLPGFIFFFYVTKIPESPRWLSSIGRTAEAKCEILKIAKFNKTEQNFQPNFEDLDETLEKISVVQKAEKNTNLGFWTLFTKRKLALNTIMLSISLSACSIAYYGITLNITQLPGNQFLNFFILTVIELPTGFIGGFFADKMGRRWMNCGFFLFTMSACILAGVWSVSPAMEICTLIAVIIAKFGVNLCFLIVYLQLTEIFPTLLRTTGNGFSGTVAEIAAASTPFAIYLGYYHKGIPYYILSAICLIGAVASSFIPETAGRNLPETINEANDFSKNDKFWSFNLLKKSQQNN